VTLTHGKIDSLDLLEGVCKRVDGRLATLEHLLPEGLPDLRNAGDQLAIHPFQRGGAPLLLFRRTAALPENYAMLDVRQKASSPRSPCKSAQRVCENRACTTIAWVGKLTSL